MTLHDIISDGLTVLDSEHESHTLSEQARRHLWMQVSRMGSYSETAEIPVMVRGEGTHVYDAQGNRYFDGLSGLFTNQIGHGRRELADVAAAQMTELGYFPLWTYAHPRAIELAEKLASLAGDLNRVFFTTGGGAGGRECVEVGPSVPPLAWRDGPLQGHQPRHRLPRHDDGCAHDHLNPELPHALRASRSGRYQDSQHQPVPHGSLR
jgi:hypothetical protein